jgi:predicted ATPase/class 3 adenylate cyclase
MRCSNCGSENSAGKKFCEDCGAPLENCCRRCGAEITVGKRFCRGCGAPLDAIGPAKVEPREGVLTGERRHLTVLFCDLVGSTEIAAQLDPEEWRDMVVRYHRAAAEAITRYGGHVAKYLGDGVMAYFGWPEAHENNAERGARAGLAVLEEVSKLNQQFTNRKVSVRVGIDSGAVVVGVGAGKDTDVFGEAPNIAARVQAAASPDTVLLTASTHRLVSGLFVVQELGAQQLKGVASPVELYQVLRPTGVRGRLAAARGLTPFVGREEELRLLLNRWERAREGEGQLVLVVGEAGIGKSRLVAEFHDRIRDAPHIWMESAGDQFFENTPFHAMTEMLSQWLELQGGTKLDERLEHLDRALVCASLRPGETAPLIVEMLQLPVRDRYPPVTLTAEQKRGRLLKALTGWVCGAARLQPVVMVVEDVHWLDPSTLELEELLAEQGATVPLMLLYTARPEFRAQWPMRSHYTQITLNRLCARNAREMVSHVAAHNALAGESVEAVVERTEGVPLFVEELTRAVLESGALKQSTCEIPVTLHDSLMARLDRLGPAKDVIQIGAVIGGEFSYELLQAVDPFAEHDLQSALRSATDAELLYVRGIAPDATYQFKHALIRDAAYEALLKSRRKELHRQVAHAIEEKFPALKESHPEVLARHWSEAGEIELAVGEWSRGGKTAEARNAFKEAEESYQRALALLHLLPESPERDGRELELRQSVFTMLNVASGWAAPETVKAAERAEELAGRSGNLAQLVSWVRSRGHYALLSGDYAGARVLAQRALDLAVREGSPNKLAEAYQLQMQTLLLHGDLVGAEENYIAGLKFFGDPSFRRTTAGLAIVAFGAASWTAWALGYPECARRREVEMIAVVDRSNPFELAFSSFFSGYLRLLMSEYEEAEVLATRALQLSETHQLQYQAALSRCILGRAFAELGRANEGVGLIRNGLAGLIETGTRSGLTRYTAFLAAAQERDGAVAHALETVEQAIAISSDELWQRPETLRLRGELLLKLGHTKLAEAVFREAIALAQRMSARAWELRTTMSLVRLLASLDGSRDEARVMLAEIYNWFTEGLDTVDLKQARALLEELRTAEHRPRS